ncbi:MAG TPA: Gfo/Idh/MocA family oxidoreductase, partial [Burkholderiaceae bacterium]
VYIATATREHAAHAIAALEAGKAVLCEKPFAIGVEQGQRVLEAAQRSGRLFMEAQWTTALPAFRELLRLARDRALGEPVLLHSEFGIAHDPAAYPRLFEGPGAGVLLDFGVYPIVLALQALGPVRSVDAAVRCNAAGVDVHATLQLTHEHGGHSQLAASLVCALPNRTSLSFAGGHVSLASPVMGAESLQVCPVAPVGAAHAGGPRAGLVAALRRRRWVRRLKAFLGGRAALERPFGVDRYAPQLSHFLALLDAGATESDLMPHATSLAVLRVVEAARQCRPPVVEASP